MFMPESIVNKIRRIVRQASFGRCHNRWRLLKDVCARYGVVAGGLGIIVAVLLIFFYLLYVVLPLFMPPSANFVGQYRVPARAQGETLALTMAEGNEVGVRFSDRGRVVFFAALTGKTLATFAVDLPASVRISSFAQALPDRRVAVYGLTDGRAVVVKPVYNVSFVNNKRVLTPALDYPLGPEPLRVDDNEQALKTIAINIDAHSATIVARTAADRLILTSYRKRSVSLAEEPELDRSSTQLKMPIGNVDYMLIDQEQRRLYLAGRDGHLSFLDIRDKKRPEIKQYEAVVKAGRSVTAMTFLNGDVSLLIGDSGGEVAQWTVVRDANNFTALRKLRGFTVSAQPVSAIAAEQRRKGFVATDAAGVVGIYNTTAERQLWKKSVVQSVPVALSLAPRANAFLVETKNGTIAFWRIDNPHPEVSLKSLWRKVWYENYPKPEYVWQSSSSSDDFEPKYSLTPLVFGTLKAAFYAMLAAIPLALLGAIYTAYFMAPGMRRWVKPGIEIMEALPTVILGFLAGLWLAPFIEANLAGILVSLLLLPMAVLLFAFCWQTVMMRSGRRTAEGWQAALLIPVILATVWLGFAVSGPLEAGLLHDSLRNWLSRRLGVGYDQRNALVVGCAMGFAVIPTIFSIAEDAIFSVPRHLSVGSLALGATPWQTMTRVVLLTASPGIFSAVMIGLGRAVGETMIVLMATGNTPVMDWSVFQGMRTLAANIAVEMPESEIDSTHYRVLFLAAFVLFLFTFIVNTVAELVRQRLREQYSAL